MKKQRSNITNLITKDYLKKELDATKKELREEIKLSAEETTKKLREEIKLSAEETVKKLEETMMGVKDILLTTMDSFAKDIETNREDRDLAVHQTSELREEIEDHEKRIKHLEKVQQAA